MADYFEEALSLAKEHNLTAKQIANAIINKKINIQDVLPASLIKQIIEENKVEEISSEDLIEIISQVLSENEKAVSEYKAGKEPALQFLLGQTMRKIGKKVDSNAIKNAILESIK